MSESPAPVVQGLEQSVLDRLAGFDVRSALAELDRLQRADAAAVVQLAALALDYADANLAAARRWVDIGAALNQRLGDLPALRAQLSYAQARLYVQNGHFALAETALRAAQAAWQASDDRSGLARSYLGLTQVLGIQGRYEEAEAAIVQAIFQLQAAANDQPELARQLASARHNLATLLVYQDKHAAALEEYARAQQLLERRIAELSATAEAAQELRLELAETQLNAANAFMALDQVYEAEAAIQTAVETFDRLADELNRGRARTNLGSLYLRTGRYAAALSQFDSATRDLIGDVVITDTIAPEGLRNADILLLDQANAYLALNLLPEATAALTRCEALFRTSGQPDELGQALLTLGVARLRNGEDEAAEAALLEAEHLFIGLQNSFWQHRTAVVLATLDYQRRALAQAAARLDNLLAQVSVDRAPTAATVWDINSLVDAQLLRLRLYLEDNNVDAARQMAAAVATTLGLPQVDLATLPATQVILPHLVLRLHHALGALERAAGNRERAQRHLRAAIVLLESQRASLPVEEIRTAFLEDKINVYSDLVLSVLGEDDPAGVAEAFAMVERARSRALLERLLATMSAEAVNETEPAAARRAELHQQLHLLYNRLIGEAGSRAATVQVGEAIRQREAALQQLEWQSAYHLPEAQPVDLPALQQALPADQQAIVYYIAGDEVLAFVISRDHAHVFRRLCSVVDLVQAKAEWRFQLGRAEMDEEYQRLHAARFERGWRAALAQLYKLLFAPLLEVLVAPRLMVIPYGPLHLLPLHALWDGQRFLLERFEWAYAPSASMAVHMISQGDGQPLYQSWAGLALNDPAIPAAREEVQAAARHFPQAWLYLDDEANQAALRRAASQGDVLHLATHGLFRPDNPFFSTLKLADGWVDVRTIYRLSLNARLVVLSACESGAGQIRSGDEVIGLARGFLALGAQSLLVSLWNVHDASSAFMMQRFYDHLIERTPHSRPAAALRSAQLEGIRANKHPYYWAPFLVMGA